jgi:hypothetical protein
MNLMRTIAKPVTTRLQHLNDTELEHEAAHSTFPKWATMCILRLARCQVLDALLIPPSIGFGAVVTAVDTFAASHRLKTVLLRSDAPHEDGDYMRGGNSYLLAETPQRVADILALRRAAIAMISTNRFTNHLSFNILVSERDGVTVELLGPGFDVSDLNRGLVAPEITITYPDCSPSIYEVPAKVFPGRFRFQHDHAALVQLRLARIAKEFLSTRDVSLNTDPNETAARWLRASKNDLLLRSAPLHVGYRQVKRFYDIAVTVYACYRSFFPGATNIVISGSSLSGGNDYIYWDISNPAIKFRHLLGTAIRADG